MLPVIQRNEIRSMPQSKKPVRRERLRQPLLRTPQSDACSKAAVILERTHDSADALLKAFELAQSERGAARGMTTDDEQDLLRAMLVMAAAGLDSMLKQLIRDALPPLVRVRASVREGLEKFVARSVRGDADTIEASTGAKFLGRVLAAESQQGQVIEEYIRDLAGGSLQSASELARTAAAFGLQRVRINDVQFKEIFNLRNRIIHELDINLDGDRRKRHLRKKKDMMKHANALLEIGEQILREVDECLAAV